MINEGKGRTKASRVGEFMKAIAKAFMPNPANPKVDRRQSSSSWLLIARKSFCDPHELDVKNVCRAGSCSSDINMNEMAKDR